MLTYSVVIPAYLRSELIELTLNSILEQDIPAIEVIIVDNNVIERESILLSELVAKNYKKSLPIKIIKSPKNSGAIARNLGASLAKGDVIAFIDSDVILNSNYCSGLLKIFESDHQVIGAQGTDIQLISVYNEQKNASFIKKFFISLIEFFEVSQIVGHKEAKVLPSLAVCHPNVSCEFYIYSQWISTCSGMFRKEAFEFSRFPENFITYSNNEYLYFSYSLFLQQAGKLVYTSKVKYKNIFTNDGRLPTLPLIYQMEVNDYFIFIKLFKKNPKNIIIFAKSRIGRLLYNIYQSIFKTKISIRLIYHSFGASIYPLINIKKIFNGDLSFYERDFG